MNNTAVLIASCVTIVANAVCIAITIWNYHNITGRWW